MCSSDLFFTRQWFLNSSQNTHWTLAFFEKQWFLYLYLNFPLNLPLPYKPLILKYTTYKSQWFLNLCPNNLPGPSPSYKIVVLLFFPKQILSLNPPLPCKPVVLEFMPKLPYGSFTAKMYEPGGRRGTSTPSFLEFL